LQINIWKKQEER